MTQIPTTPQAGGNGDPQPQAGTTPPTEPQAGSGKTPEDYERMITQLRAENAANRVKLKKHEDEEAARQQAQMTESERLKAALAEKDEQLENTASRLYRMAVREEVEELADKFNFVLSPKKLTTMLLADEDDNPIEFEDGKPTNIEKLLEKLAKTEPNLVKQQEQQQQQGAPTLPAMNPGRSSITPPGQGQLGKRPSWDDVTWKR